MGGNVTKKKLSFEFFVIYTLVATGKIIKTTQEQNMGQQCFSALTHNIYTHRQQRSQLKTATFDSVTAFEPPSGMCKVVDAYDADTCRVALAMGDGTLAKFTVRLAGIDAPERKPAKASPLHDLEKAAALRCRAKFLTMVTAPNTFGLDFTGYSAKEGCGKSHALVRLEGKMFDKYGRILGTLYDATGRSINEQLAKEGWVRRYEGATREPWTKKELEAIMRKKA